ncbi:MAG TPA: ABC transporter permease, partial [Saprospiraceae bacterium]|nr:ABC transporter permease [Saprospiraceae bacterium]
MKYKVYAAINIFGLSVGIAASLLIWQMLRYEMQYNHNFAQHERIGRLYMRTIGNPSGDRADRGVTVPAMIEFQQKITDIEASSRIREDWPTITVPDPAGGPPLKKISAANENIGFFVEPGFFKVFDLHWVAGSPSQFEELGSTVLNRSSAEILFGTPEAAIGKNIMLDNTVPSIVRGVYEDLPHNCDIAAYALTSFVTLRAHRDAY